LQGAINRNGLTKCQSANLLINNHEPFKPERIMFDGSDAGLLVDPDSSDTPSEKTIQVIERL
jgi:hypothetical protein